MTNKHYTGRVAEAAARAKANRVRKVSLDYDWKTVATETLDALRMINAHLNDLYKSNPGFMGKMCLKDYGLWNEGLLKSERVLARYKDVL